MNRIVNIKVHLTVIYGCDTMSRKMRGNGDDNRFDKRDFLIGR
jgi:hypothetical protein